jgi:hypothetical protein
MLRRINTQGRTYTLEKEGSEGNRTKVSVGGKSIIVDVPLEEMNQAWYYWTVQGKFVQDAFRSLNADEREFLMTGLTKEEWAKLFAGEEE